MRAIHLVFTLLIGSLLAAQAKEDVLESARKALGERRYDRCLEILAQAPDGAERYRLEGEARFFKGETREAARALERYLSLAGDAPEVPRVRFRLAECFSRMGKLAEAVALTRKGLSAVADPGRRLGLARRLLDIGLKAARPDKADSKPDYAAAHTFFREAEPFAEDDAPLMGEVRFAAGKTFFLQKKHREALQILAPLVGVEVPLPLRPRKQRRSREELPGLDVDRPLEKPRLEDAACREEAARMVGASLLALNHPGRAREVFRASFMRNPTGAEAPACLLGVARSYGFPMPSYRNALARGTEALERLIQSFPDHARLPEALDLLAKAHRAFNRPERALHYQGELVRKYPASDLAPPAAREIARIHRSKKDFPGALEAYDRALAAFPTHRLWSEIRRERIDCEYQCATEARTRGDRASATRLFTEFLKRHPLDGRVPAILLALGQIAEKSKKIPEAVKHYSTLASKYPGTNQAVTARLARAALEEKAGDFKAACATLKSVPRGGGRDRLKVLEGTHLALETRHAVDAPRLLLTTRNLEKVEMRLYRISAGDYFQKHLTLEKVADLDVPLIRPNHTWTLEVKDYVKYKKMEMPVEMPGEGKGAFVLSAVAGDLRATTLVLESDLRMVARMAGDRIDVLVSRTRDLKPVAGASVLVAGAKRILLRGETGKDGTYTGTFLAHSRPSVAVTVLAGVGEEVAWTRVVVPVRTSGRKGSGVLLWTDRTRYRSGETIRFWALVRGKADLPRKVEFLGKEGIRLRRFTLAPAPGGVIQGAFTLPGDVGKGTWILRVLEGKKTVASQKVEVVEAVDRLLRVEVEANARRVRLGRDVTFTLKARNRWGHPAKYEKLTYRVSGDPVTHALTTDEDGRARIALPTDRFGLNDSVALDVFQGNTWIAGTVVPVIWDGFRAKVETDRDVYRVGGAIRARVSAVSFDKVREARDVTVVVRRVLEGGRSEEVCRVPVRTATRGEDVAVALPIPGEGAFSLLLEGDEGMVASGSALFISGPDDPRKIRILAGRDPVRPGTPLKLQVHCRGDRVSAVMVVANHRDQRIRRIGLNRGGNEISIPIRERDLPWLRIRIGAPMDDGFHTDEVTLAVEDPLKVSLTAQTPGGRPDRKVTLRLKVEDAAGRGVRTTAVLLMVPESLLPLYRGFFQGVGESFMGDTKAEDSPLASSFPFTYRSSGERVAILGERRRDLPGFRSNWASIVDRNAVVAAARAENNPVYQSAQVFFRDVASSMARPRGQRAQTLTVGQQMAQQDDLTEEIGWSLGRPGRPSNVINPMFLNQGSGQVFLSRNEAAQILGQSNDGTVSGTFQDLDYFRNGWNPASVLLCSRGALAIPKEDLETRLRHLAVRLLKHGSTLASPRFFLVETGDDGTGTVSLRQPEGKWRVLVLACSLDKARFGEGVCSIEGAWKIRARVVAPRRPGPGDASEVAVLLTGERTEQVPVRLSLKGRPAVERKVQLSAGLDTRVRFPLKAGDRPGLMEGEVHVGDRVIPVRVTVVPEALDSPASCVRSKTTGGEKSSAPALSWIRKVLDGNRSHLDRAAWIIARIAEIRSAGGNAGEDSDLETRLAWLLLAAGSDGGWSFQPGGSSSDVDTSVLGAWAVGAAEAAGLRVPGPFKKRLVGYLRKQFSRARDGVDKAPLLLGLSRLGSVDFAHVNRLYRARASLSCRDLAAVLLLLRRQGDDSQMVKILAALLKSKVAGDGSFARSGPVEPLSDVRATTALAAMALFGLDAGTADRALAHLDTRPMCPGREAAGLALEAAVRGEIRSPADRWVLRKSEAPGKAVEVRVEREVRYLPMQCRGYTLHRGFDVAGGYRDRYDHTERVGEGKRFRVDLRVKLPYAMAHVLVEEAVPSGMRLVADSIRSRVAVDVEDGVLRFHLPSHERRRKGTRWFVTTYHLEAALPGHYRFRTPRVLVPGGDRLVVKTVRKTQQVTVVPLGEDDRKGYHLTPREHEGLGLIYWSLGQYDRAYPHLDTLMKKWRLRQPVQVRAAALLLDMDVRWKNHKGMVEHFEVLKESDPDRTVPFRKIVPVAEAYAALEEHERALQVQRGCLGGFFRVDFGFGNALLNAGDLEGFRAFVVPLLALYPADEATLDSRYFLGQTLLDQARKAGADQKAKRTSLLGGAVRAFRAAMEAGGGGPGTEASMFALAGTLLEQEKFDAAAGLCRRAVKLFPDSHLKDGFEYVLAYSLFEQGLYDRAETICARIVVGEYRNAAGRTGPSMNRDLTLHMLAKIHHARGDIVKAVEAYRKVKDRFPDAGLALNYFEWRVLDMPEITELAVGEDRSVRLTYKNVDRVQVRAYRVDLMTLYLRERSLNRIASINLAGIKPFFEGSFPVRPSTYRMDGVDLAVCRKKRDRSGPGDPIAVVLPAPGAYLLVVRSGETECMGMVLRTDLQMDVQTVRDKGTLRATVYDRTSGTFASRVEVKFVGSQDKAFTTARTDLRGVAETTGIRGLPTVIARSGDQYAFFRSGETLGPRRKVPARGIGYRGPAGDVPLDGRLGNFQKQLDALNLFNRQKVKEQQSKRGGVQIRSVK